MSRHRISVFLVLLLLAGAVSFLWEGIVPPPGSSLPPPTRPSREPSLPTWSDASARTADEILRSYEGRLAALRDSIHRNPGDSAAVARLARLVQIVRPDEAAEHYERYLEMNPGSREARLDLTVAYVMAGRLPEALVTAREQLEIWPDDAEAMYNLGAIYANLGDLDEARIWWERVSDSGMGGGFSSIADDALKRTAPFGAR